MDLNHIRDSEISQNGWGVFFLVAVFWSSFLLGEWPDLCVDGVFFKSRVSSSKMGPYDRCKWSDMGSPWVSLGILNPLKKVEFMGPYL